MNAHRIETTLTENGTLTLRDLPFEAGSRVLVIVLELDEAERQNKAGGAERSIIRRKKME